MKRILLSLLMAVGISGPFVVNLAAEINQEGAEIPFAFVASHRLMPAGHYRISQLTAENPMFTLTGANGHSTFVQLGKNEKGEPDKPSLTFACYGKECVLAKITPPNSRNSFALSQESIEKSLPHKLGMASMISVRLTRR